MHKTAKLLTITFILDNFTALPDSVAKNTDLFQPLLWKRVSGTHGKGLLQLKPIYEMLSMSLLGYETEESLIQIKSKPLGCMTNITDKEYELFFRKFLLNFTKEYDEICNEHIENISGQATFFYECCLYDFHGNMQCNRVLINKWMRAIYDYSYIVIGIVLLYCPLLIPAWLYDPNFGPKDFVHRLTDPAYTFTVKIMRAPTTCWSKTCERLNKLLDFQSNHVPYSRFEGMTKFKTKVENKSYDKIFQFKLTKVYLNVKTNEIVASNEVPVSLLGALRDLCLGCVIEHNEGLGECCRTTDVRNKKVCCSICETKNKKCVTACCKNCKIKNQEGLKDCCQANIFGKCIGMKYPWYKLLHFLNRFVLSVAICLPWIIRVCIFYVYEYDIRESRYKAAETRNLLVRIENNLTYYGTPVHILFIFSYCLMCFGYLCLELTSVILFKDITSLVQKILTEIFSGMCNRSKMKVIQWSVKVLLKPFTVCGMFGVVFAVPFWILAVPFTFTVSAYYLFPTVHITFNFLCLFLNIFRKFNLNLGKIWKKSVVINRCIRCFSFRDFCLDKEVHTTPHEETKCLATGNVNQPETKPNLRFYEIGLMFFLVCLILSSVLLTVEFVIFFMKVMTYTMIGLILNSSHAMQYISTISLAWLYYHRCFGGISQIYKSYNEAFQTIIHKVNELRADEITKQEMKEHKNQAFKLTVTGENLLIQGRDIGTYDGVPKFKTNGVILLFDKFDKQYTTKQFLFNVCTNMPDGPGPYIKHFCIALRQFFVIFLFLILVTLVVLAFGDSYSVSFPNQLLATLAGGVVPWILMKTNVLFSQADPPNVEEIVKRYFPEQTNATANSSENSSNTDRLFKKTFDNEIEKDSKWWIIGDIDVADDKIDEMDLTVEPPEETPETFEPQEETTAIDCMNEPVEPTGEGRVDLIIWK